LNLEHNEIDNIGANSIAKSLECNTTLTSLNLSENRFRLGVRSIVKSLECNSTLTNLDLRNCFFHKDEEKRKKYWGVFNKIAKSLDCNTTLNSLDISGNYISRHELKSIAKLLETNRTLTELSVTLDHLDKVHDVQKAFEDVSLLNKRIAIKIINYRKRNFPTLPQTSRRKWSE